MEVRKNLKLNGDKVYMKKDWLGWRQIYPIKKDDGSWNYPNLLFGGYRNLIFLVIVMLALLLLVSSYKHDTADCNELFHPDNLRDRVCSLCSHLTSTQFSIDDIMLESFEDYEE